MVFASDDEDNDDISAEVFKALVSICIIVSSALCKNM